MTPKRPPGRPPLPPEQRLDARIEVRLTREQRAKADRLGRNAVSQLVREALDRAPEPRS